MCLVQTPALPPTDQVTLGNSPNLYRWRCPDKEPINLGLKVGWISDVDSHKERGHTLQPQLGSRSPSGDTTLPARLGPYDGSLGSGQQDQLHLYSRMSIEGLPSPETRSHNSQRLALTLRAVISLHNYPVNEKPAQSPLGC